MKKSLIVVSLLIATLSSSTAKSLEDIYAHAKPVRKTSLIGKKLVYFEMYAGNTSRWKSLPNGDTLQYWDSRMAGFFVTKGDDGMGTQCILILKTDSRKRIVDVRIVEDGIACGPALR